MIEINNFEKVSDLRNEESIQKNNNDYFEFSDKTIFNSTNYRKKRLSNIEAKNIQFIPLIDQKDKEINPEERLKISIIIKNLLEN